MNADAIATLLSDPSRANAIAQDDVPEVLGQVERLRAQLWARLTRPESTNGCKPASDIERASADRLLTVKEAANRLTVDERWMYRHADSLPFTRRLGERTLRFSETGLEKWLSRR